MFVPGTAANEEHTNDLYQAIRFAGSWIQDAWSSIVNASDPAPNDLPSGTRPIDRWGISRGDIHDIKEGVFGDSNPTGYVGIMPQGQVIIAGPWGKAEDAGHVDQYTNRPLRQFPRPSD